MMIIGTSEPRLSQAQPWVVTKAPDPNEVIAITKKTQKLMAPWALSFPRDERQTSTGLCLP